MRLAAKLKSMNWMVIASSALCLIVTAGLCFAQPQGRVCVQEHCFDVELAQTEQERAQGLMFREFLGPDQGMLFIFPEEEKHPFWMKNTLIPLDIIWLDQDKSIVFIAEDIQPCTDEPCPLISPPVRAKYVLELNAQRVKEIGLSLGDKLEFSW